MVETALVHWARVASYTRGHMWREAPERAVMSTQEPATWPHTATRARGTALIARAGLAKTATRRATACPQGLHMAMCHGGNKVPCCTHGPLAKTQCSTARQEAQPTIIP